MNRAPGSVVVLFNPTEAHVDNLLGLKRLCAEVVAVDNSLHVDLRLHQRMRELGIDVVVNSNRGGIAGAFNRGMEQLLEKQCDLLFTFDQDSEVPDDFFRKMIEAAEGLKSPYFLLGPKIYDTNVDHYIPLLILSETSFRARFIFMSDEDQGLVPCTSVISSGCVMSAETYRGLGAFREDYFIDYVDAEYSFRARSHGIPVYTNTSLTMKHELGNAKDHKILGVDLVQWNYVPLRLYYAARNSLDVSRLYRSTVPSAPLINLMTVSLFLSVLLFEDKKLRKMGALFAGVFDGLFGRLGSMETCQPLIAALCMPPAPRKPLPYSQANTTS
jgi:rhamnosyltransferase